MNRILIKFYKNEQTKPTVYRSVKSKRIFAKIVRDKFSKVYLKVTYAPDEINEGFYNKRSDLKQALRSFLEVKNATT